MTLPGLTPESLRRAHEIVGSGRAVGKVVMDGSEPAPKSAPQ
ncbi:hypothetical protein [Parafrankia colletiae]|nr:hypothetical protein [Parafrankia colletiae]